MIPFKEGATSNYPQINHLFEDLRTWEWGRRNPNGPQKLRKKHTKKVRKVVSLECIAYLPCHSITMLRSPFETTVSPVGEGGPWWTFSFSSLL